MGKSESSDIPKRQNVIKSTVTLKNLRLMLDTLSMYSVDIMLDINDSTWSCSTKDSTNTRIFVVDFDRPYFVAMHVEPPKRGISHKILIASDALKKIRFSGNPDRTMVDIDIDTIDAGCVRRYILMITSGQRSYSILSLSDDMNKNVTPHKKIVLPGGFTVELDTAELRAATMCAKRLSDLVTLGAVYSQRTKLWKMFMCSGHSRRECSHDDYRPDSRELDMYEWFRIRPDTLEVDKNAVIEIQYPKVDTVVSSSVSVSFFELPVKIFSKYFSTVAIEFGVDRPIVFSPAGDEVSGFTVYYAAAPRIEVG
jgi:hypothetical protein